MDAKLPSKVLVVDNDEAMLNAVAEGLSKFNINVVKANGWEKALYHFNNERFDLCIIAFDLDEMPGTVLIQKWRKHEVEGKRDCAYIISVGLKYQSELEALLLELGDIKLTQKPFKIPVLIGLMTSALDVAKQSAQLDQIQNKIIDPLIKQKKLDKAVKIAQEKLEPLGLRGKFQSAVIHKQAEDLKRSLSLLQSLAASDTNNMKYHNEIANILLDLGRNKEAMASYEKADKAAPLNLERMQQMSKLYLESKQPDESIAKMKDILAINPDKPELKFKMYEDLLDAGFDSHAQEFCKLTSVPRELVRHYNNKGVVHSKAENYDKAISEYHKALNLIPNSKEIYRILYNLAIAHINLKSKENIEKAKEFLEKCLSISPDYDKAVEKLALTEKYLNNKSPEEEEALFIEDSTKM